MAQAHCYAYITIRPCFLCFFYNPYMSFLIPRIFHLLVYIVVIVTVTMVHHGFLLSQFLDAQRIHNLTDYLKVRERGGLRCQGWSMCVPTAGPPPERVCQCRSHHPPPNCYTKLRDTDQLDAFVAVSNHGYQPSVCV